MATKAEKVLKEQSKATLSGNAQIAAMKYINQGLKGLGLKPREELAVKKRLLPIVKNQIQLDRGRTVSRGKGIVAREARARVKKATEGM
jgi:hypothetical protein